MKKIIFCSCLFLLSTCVLIACGSDDSSSETPSPGNKNNTPGLFQINAGGTKVCFAPGNLQATYNGSTWNWAFATNQWDYINGIATYRNDNGTVSLAGTVDLFGWVGETSTWMGAAQYGISIANAVNSRYTYGNIASEALKSDWGNTISDGYKWRTLSFSEWTYVFNTRNSGSTVNGTSNARYTYATINTDNNAVKGIILFPDDITVEGSAAASWGKINYISQVTECTSAQWSNLAAKGCVFLPAAGYRFETTIKGYNSGFYWSSSSNTTDASSAYVVRFDSSDLNPAANISRPAGCSVRLVREVK